jgi:hypothetical protein
MRSSRMYVDIWSIVALRQRQSDQVRKLCKMKLIKRSPKLTLLVAYYRVSNATLKQLMKTKVQVTSLLRRIMK